MKTVLPILFILFAINAQAQMTDCNVFLQGRYVEVGINFNGAYGSSVAAPAVGYCGTSFHPNGPVAEKNSDSCGGAIYSGGFNIGFVADPDKDGWTSGLPYPFYGDYFLPGSPQEGWSIQADGIKVDNFNSMYPSAPGPHDSVRFYGTGNGGNISYSTSGATLTAIWQGTWDSLLLTQYTTLDTSQTFFVTHVIIKNIGKVTRHNVYYQRTLDPDNVEPQTGNFATYNLIEHQWPDTSGKVLVSTWGLESWGDSITNAYLGLGTTDTNARVYILPSGLTPPNEHTLDSIWSGYYYYRMAKGASDKQDEGVGIVYNIGDLVPVDSVIISYAYAFRRGKDLDSALKLTGLPFTPPAINTDTGNHTLVNPVANNTNISIYPNPLTNEMIVSGIDMNGKLMIYDMMGRFINAWAISNGKNTFDISAIPSGMYLVKIIDVNGNVIRKMPVQKQ